MLRTILSISGKPGLYKLVSRAKNNLVVEILDGTHRRMPAFSTDRIMSLGDIAMYTEADDVPLGKVLENMKALENGKPSSVDFRKASGEQLKEYFAKILPDFDRERVHNSDIKKLIQWYDILINNGITDFEEKEDTAENAESAAVAEEKPAETETKPAETEKKKAAKSEKKADESKKKADKGEKKADKGEKKADESKKKAAAKKK